jgi:uncharacterized membrane protein
LLADGLLQTGYLVLLIAGFVWYAGLRRRDTLARRSAWAGFLLGLGAFQLFDGIVDHQSSGPIRSVTTSTCCPTTWPGTGPR